jgi:hypothetical protein
LPGVSVAADGIVVCVCGGVSAVLLGDGAVMGAQVTYTLIILVHLGASAVVPVTVGGFKDRAACEAASEAALGQWVQDTEARERGPVERHSYIETVCVPVPEVD